MRVKIDGVFQTSGSLAAFVGDEMRALATPSAVLFGPLMNDGTVLFMMSFWADQAEQLTWKFCDGARMVAVDPPCSFTDAAVGLPPFLPKCTRLGPLSPYGVESSSNLDVVQYFTGTTDQCTVRAGLTQPPPELPISRRRTDEHKSAAPGLADLLGEGSGPREHRGRHLAHLDSDPGRTWSAINGLYLFKCPGNPFLGCWYGGGVRVGSEDCCGYDQQPDAPSWVQNCICEAIAATPSPPPAPPPPSPPPPLPLCNPIWDANSWIAQVRTQYRWTDDRTCNDYCGQTGYDYGGMTYSHTQYNQSPSQFAYQTWETGDPRGLACRCRKYECGSVQQYSQKYTHTIDIDCERNECGSGVSGEAAVRSFWQDNSQKLGGALMCYYDVCIVAPSPPSPPSPSSPPLSPPPPPPPPPPLSPIGEMQVECSTGDDCA